MSMAPPWLSARTLLYYRDLVLVLVAKDFKLRYKSTFLGYAWSVLHPLALAVIFFLLFRVIARVRVEAYALYLIAGLFPWQGISNSCVGANAYFLGNGPLIKKVRFQRATLVLAGVLNEMVHLLVSMPVIVAFMLYYGRAPGWYWLWAVPLLLAVQGMLTIGVALAIATTNLFFRDLERLVALAVQMLFYLTPIIYPLEMVPREYHWIAYANPFAALVACWQGVFYAGHVPAAFLGVAITWSCGLLAIGVGIYRRKVWRFAEVV